jgi:DTW domain-containing protein YfiP
MTFETRNPDQHPKPKRNTLRSASLENRCEGCQLRRVLCICEIIPKMAISTKVIVLMHLRETHLTTNTAKLVKVALEDSEIRLRGEKGKRMDDEGLISPERQSLFLFPSAEAQVLTRELVASFGKPVTLIVPDGSWRQAKKVAKREPALASIPQVKLPAGELSTYRLRREPNAESVSTFEAITRALGILEGNQGPGVREKLEHLFDVMVERLLWSRGVLPKEECRHPIPQAAIDEFFIAGCRGSMARPLLTEVDSQ